MLRLPLHVLEAIRAHARRGSPHEVCGILAGRDEGATRVVEHAIPVRNAHPDPRAAYRLDPEEQLRAILRVEDELRLAVVGFYHSHPAGPARFSAEDVAQASWPGASYLLVHLAPHEGERSARYDEARRALADEPIGIAQSRMRSSQGRVQDPADR